MTSGLDCFHPIVRHWFLDQVGAPTDVQARAWPVIASGRHVLASAPTGAGKTLTAFLWALDRFLTGAWEPGSVRVLYVSPLKALNNDIQRNLLDPLNALRARFAAEGLAPTDIRALTRSGDTPSDERQRMVRRPPEILITTPESLHLILSSPRARAMLRTVETCILDEVHAVAESKRGALLMACVERLTLLAGEVQRVALSATVRPLDVVAAFIGGFRRDGDPKAPRYLSRPVEIVQSDAQKRYDLHVRFPFDPLDIPREQSETSPLLRRLAGLFADIAKTNRSTLLFANNRRLAERLSLLINEGQDELLAYSHHGSLSREIRAVVEQRMKAGELRAIVATSSLELGIDIGALDEVILIDAPQTVAAAVQRVGRAGHRVGETSRGAFYPVGARALVDAAVTARCIREQDIEALRPVALPLDVLAQLITAMCCVDAWDVEELCAFIRSVYAFRSLTDTQFALTVGMLAGRYEETRIRALKPLLSVDLADGVITARPGAARVLYASGGTIPDRGYYTLRRADTNARIGELDEEFVWERRRNDAFSMGMQTWRIKSITHSDVLVEPAKASIANVPFWKAEEPDRSFHLSERIGLFLERLERALSEKDARLFDQLCAEYALDEAAAAGLLRHLRLQREASGAPLPHRHHVLVERFSDPNSRDAGAQIALHTIWGGRVNRPLAFALAQAWEDRYGGTMEVLGGNNSVLLMTPGRCGPEDVFSLTDPDQITSLLRRRLERTGFFGAQFRENAARALLLPRASFKRRMPLWLNRQRSLKILEAVSAYPDFPIMVETWRSCLVDAFDLDTLRSLLEEVRDGRIETTCIETARPTPFVQDALWRATNTYMYEGDVPRATATSALDGDLIQEAVHSSALRPRLSRDLVDRFAAKAQRTHPGYAPRDATELLDWLKERLWTPLPEWEALLAAIARDTGQTTHAVVRGLDGKAGLVRAGDAEQPGAVARDALGRTLEALGLDMDGIAWTPLDEGEPGDAPEPQPRKKRDQGDALAEWLSEWLRCYGPVTRTFLRATLPVGEARLADALDTLVKTRTAVIDRLTESATEAEICDAENLEILLRLTRSEARPDFDPLPAHRLPLFLAHHQGVAVPSDDRDATARAAERLIGLPLPPALLEAEALPARIPGYRTSMLDTLFNETDLRWWGGPGKRVTLGLLPQRELFHDPAAAAPEKDAQWREILPRLFADPRGRYDFDALLEHTGLNVSELTESLWEFVWDGRLSNDAYAALRKGIQERFRAPADAQPMHEAYAASNRPHLGPRRVGFRQWKAARSWPGRWYALPEINGERDVVDEEELNRERVRILLDRYGVLFRELLQRERPAMRWGAVFRTLRRMELAGEALAGAFFDGAPGLQFMSHAAFRTLQQGLPDHAIYWLHATDPASLCGIELPGLKQALPRRAQGVHLAYHGADLVLVSQRTGRTLDIRVPPDDPNLEAYFGFMRHLLTRDYEPASSIEIETINDEPAVRSPYLTFIRDFFDVVADAKKATVWRRG